MRVLRLQAENVMKLVAIDITPEGDAVVIGGSNGAGKTSALKAIEFALAGKGSHCDVPVRQGADGAKVVLDLGEEHSELVVTRQWSGGRTTLKVENAADRSRKASPQELLSELVGPLSFDPLAFLGKDEREQADTLRQLVGLDLSDIDRRRDVAYTQRRDVNREVRSLEGNLGSCPVPPDDTPDEKVSISGLLEELREARQRNGWNESHRARARKARAAVDGEGGVLEQLREVRSRIEFWNGRLLELEKKERDLEAAACAAEAEAEALVDIDTAAINDRLASAEVVNGNVRLKLQRQRVAAGLEDKRAESKRYTELLAELDQKRADRIAAADYPIEGLGVDDGVVTWGGVPLSQASSAEQLRVSVAMGLALNRKLKVMLVRNASLLDDEGLRVICEMAADAGAQVWLERVGEGEECSVIIEEGRVRETRQGSLL